MRDGRWHDDSLEDITYITKDFELIKRLISDKSLVQQETPQIDEHYYIEKYGLKNYHMSFIKNISRQLNFAGKTVLEIGGSNFPYEIIKDFLKVKKWVCVDIPNWQSNKKDKIYQSNELCHKHHPITICDIKKVSLQEMLQTEDYFIMKGLSKDMSTEFHNQFDIVISLCCFEHVFNLAYTLDKIYHSLKDGGVLYSYFSPIWSDPRGYHVKNKEVYPQIDSWLPPYTHLLYSLHDITEMLLNHLPLKKAEYYAYEAKYHSTCNKLFYEDYNWYLKKSLFKDYIITPTGKSEGVGEDVVSKLKLLYPDNSFDSKGCAIFAQKE